MSVRNNRLSLTVGMGSIDDYLDYADAGADEVFCGYIPGEWMLKAGPQVPLNRREVLYYNVQLGSESELAILKDMKRERGVPVTLTFNALSYPPQFYPFIKEIMKRCCELEFTSFIVADPGLLLYLQEDGFAEEIKTHISGEFGEMNSWILKKLKMLGADRIIFHRKMTSDEMTACVKTAPELEYEAFVLNEMCHFHGAFCNSLHCDELMHMCLEPYRLSGSEGFRVQSPNEQNPESYCDEYRTGESGCGLCALPALKEAGVRYLKVVSRGAATEDTLQDIRNLKRAVLLAEQFTPQEYIRRMKSEIFLNGCSGNCYYRIKKVKYD